MKEVIAGFCIVVGIVLFGAALSLALAFPVMWCWNYAVVHVWPNVPAIGWGHAWGLTFLAGRFINFNFNNIGKS